MSIFGKVFDVVGDFGSTLYKGAKNTVSGGFDAVGNVFSSGVAGGVSNVLSSISGPVGTIGNLIGIGGAIGNLVSDKDSGQGSPLGSFTGLQGAPNPVATTTGTGGGNAGNLINNNLLGAGLGNQGSGQSFFPNAPIENQSGIIDTNQSSIGFLAPVGTGLANQAFQPKVPKPKVPKPKGTLASAITKDQKAAITQSQQAAITRAKNIKTAIISIKTNQYFNPG